MIGFIYETLTNKKNRIDNVLILLLLWFWPYKLKTAKKIKSCDAMKRWIDSLSRLKNICQQSSTSQNHQLKFGGPAYITVYYVKGPHLF